jgi:hypothetical protein
MKNVWFQISSGISLALLLGIPLSTKAQSIRMVRPDSNGFFTYSTATKGEPNSTAVACIGFVDGRFLPGKTVGGWNNCNVPWGKSFVEARNFYIVNGGKWLKAEEGFIPSGAYNATDKGDPVYICLGWVGNSWQPGHTVSGWRNCNIAQGNKNLEIRPFWVLGQ